MSVESCCATVKYWGNGAHHDSRIGIISLDEEDLGREE
jgi:hypothetical protein